MDFSYGPEYVLSSMAMWYFFYCSTVLQLSNYGNVEYYQKGPQFHSNARLGLKKNCCSDPTIIIEILVTCYTRTMSISSEPSSYRQAAY